MAGQLDITDISLEIVPDSGAQILITDIALEIVPVASAPSGDLTMIFEVMVAGVPTPIYFEGIVVGGVVQPVEFLGIEQGGTPQDPYLIITYSTP